MAEKRSTPIDFSLQFSAHTISSRIIRYSVPILTVLLALWIQIRFHNLFGEASFLLFSGAVIISAWFGGLKSGILATVLSAILIDYYLLPPLQIIGIDDIGLRWQYTIFIIQGIFISSLSGVLYSSLQNAREKTKQYQESEERFRLFVDRTKDYGIFVLNAEGYIKSWNIGAERITGYKEDEVLGKHISIFSTEEKVKQRLPWKELQTAKSTGKFEDEGWRIKRDGSKFWSNILTIALKDEQGKLRGFAKIMRDMTERMQMETELRKSKEQMETFFYNISEGITVQDATGKLIYANDAAARTIGLKSVDELMNVPPTYIADHFDLMDEQGTPLTVTNLPGRLALQGKLTPDMTVCFRIKKTGEVRWSTVKARPIFDDQGKVLYAINVFADITDRKELERRKDEFISIASHELKTPITTIKAFTQLLKMRFQQINDTTSVNFLSKMDSQLDRLTNLVSDTLDVSKIQAGKLQLNEEVFDFEDFVTEIIDSIQPTLKNHTIIKKGQSHTMVLADKNRIEQVFVNLISNAAKYSPHGKKIVVTVKAEKKHMKIGIQDFGIGIEKSQLSKVFDRFYRIEHKGERFSGMGLGLYISAEIISRHEGKIWVESKKGKGSTFYFTLPIALRSRLLKKQ